MLVLAGAGCGGEDGSPAPRSANASEQRAAARQALARPALCGPLRVRVTGRVGSAAATELSGLVVSRSQARVLWSHNDSGDGPRLLAFTPGGRALADLQVAGAQNLDWEDMATGPAAGPRDALYVGDIGDNDRARPEIVVLRLIEPAIRGGGQGTIAGVRRLALRYPDGPHDAEALLVDPSSGAIVIVVKDFRGTAGVYTARRPSPTSVTTMRRAGLVSLGPLEAVTGGDVSANGRTIVLRTYDRVFAWTRRRGQSVASALRRRPCAPRAALLGEGQGEAIALTRDGRAFYTVPEGPRPAVRRYARPR